MGEITQEKNIQMLEKLSDGNYLKKNPETKASLVKCEDGSSVDLEIDKLKKTVQGTEKALGEHKADMMQHGAIRGNDGYSYTAIVGDEQLSNILESNRTGGSISRATEDNDFFYIWRETGKKPYKVRKSDLETVSTGYGTDLQYSPLVVDDDFLYISEGNKLTLLDKNSLSKVKSDAVTYSKIHQIDIDNRYIYLGVNKTNNSFFIKIDKITLEVIAESEPVTEFLTNSMYMVNDNEYVYGVVGDVVVKMSKSNLSKVATSPTLGRVDSIASDNDFLYVGGQNSGGVVKLRKSNLTKVAESSYYYSYGAKSISVTDNHIYSVITGGKVVRLNKSDLSENTVWNSGSGTLGISADNDDIYLYGFGTSSSMIVKVESITEILGLRRVD